MDSSASSAPRRKSFAKDATSRKWYQLPKSPTLDQGAKSPKSERWSIPKLNSPTLVSFPSNNRRDSGGKFSSPSAESDESSNGEEVPTHILDTLPCYNPQHEQNAPLVELSARPGGKKYASLMSQDSLRQALEDPTFGTVGLAKFGAFLASELGAEQLCFWLNAQQLSSDLQALQSLCRRVHDLHVPTAAPLALNLSNAERKCLEASSVKLQILPDPFAEQADVAFQAMHEDSWSRFVKLRLTLAQKAFVKTSQQNRDSFCLADLRDGPDMILSMCSKGFQTLTGYSLKETLSMNCRELQGPESSPAVVARIRKALKVGADIQELMINYTKEGTPFWVLLQMKCLRDETGAVRYILGHQLNLSSQTSDLSWLLNDTLDVTQGHDSEIVQEQREALRSSQSVASTRIENSIKDRNQRLQDASALAFEATSGRHQGPGRAMKRKPTFEVVQAPTSACAPLGVLGATSSKQPREVISDPTQLNSPAEVLQWQNQTPAKFVFLDPETLTIRFSSPALPCDWAQGASFGQLIEELNLPGSVAEIKKQIAKQDFFMISPRLRVFPPGSVYTSQGRICPLAITPLLNRKAKVSAVVVMFGW